MSDDTESVLDDLFSGRDRFLTAGEVAELLNVNTNTLYLWRQSEEVALPFHRFIAPGQSRGMIRYKYSDVYKFIERGALMGSVSVAVESDDEAAARMEDVLRKQARAQKAASDRANADHRKHLARPLEELLDEAIPDVPDVVSTPSVADDIIKQLLDQYSLDKDV